MKGLVILATLAALIAAALFALLRDSYRDLARLEDAAAEALEAASDDLSDATRTLNPLRVVNPTAIPLDDDLAAQRRRLDELRARLDELRQVRPEQEKEREAFLAARREHRDAARDLHAASQGLLARAEVLDQILRETQPRVQEMLALMGLVAQARHQVEDEGRLDPTLATKLDQLQERVGRTRQLAAESRRAAMQDAADAERMNRTVAGEVAAVTQDLAAAMNDLQHSGAPDAAAPTPAGGG